MNNYNSTYVVTECLDGLHLILFLYSLTRVPSPLFVFPTYKIAITTTYFINHILNGKFVQFIFMYFNKRHQFVSASIIVDFINKGRDTIYYI